MSIKHTIFFLMSIALGFIAGPLQAMEKATKLSENFTQPQNMILSATNTQLVQANWSLQLDNVILQQLIQSQASLLNLTVEYNKTLETEKLALQHKLAQVQATVNALTKTIAEKDKAIATKDNDLGALKTQNREFAIAHTNLKTEIAELQKTATPVTGKRFLSGEVKSKSHVPITIPATPSIKPGEEAAKIIKKPQHRIKQITEELRGKQL